MFGKMKLSVAAAQKDLDNAQLALRRARYDLATNVRNAYFALIVAQETVRVNAALALFTDKIYRLYTGYLAGGFAAPYEPARSTRPILCHAPGLQAGHHELHLLPGRSWSPSSACPTCR